MSAATGRNMGASGARREFLKGLGAASLGMLLHPRVHAATAVEGVAQTGGYERLLILVELKGANDGLNTVVPYADPEYYLSLIHI